MTPSVRRFDADIASARTCSKRHAVPISSLTNRGQTDGSPVDPDDTATKSHSSSAPARQSAASGNARW